MSTLLTRQHDSLSGDDQAAVLTLIYRQAQTRPIAKRSPRHSRRKGGRHGRVREGAARAPEATTAPGPRPGEAPEAAARSSRRMRWWERNPERLERELSALRDVAYDPQPLEVAGRMRVRVQAKVNGSQHELEIRYPDLFPHFRFNIYAPIGLFPRHQQPFTGDLCILAPDSDAWDEDDTAADILATQLTQIAAINSGDARGAQETDQIEAVSMYFNYSAPASGEVFVLPSEAYEIDRQLKHGTMTLRVTGEPPKAPRGYVTHVGATRGSLPDLSAALGVGHEREI